MISQHSLDTLEYHKVIRAIHGQCLTAYGHTAVDQIQPLFDVETINRKQSEIAQMIDIIRFGSAFPLYRLEDTREYLERATVEGTHLDPKDILKVLELVEVSIGLNRYDKEERDKFPAVAEYLPRIRAFPELQKEIRKTIDEDGNVRDNASPALKRIRIDIQDSRRRIITRLEGILAGQQKQAGWQDDVVTQRNGRYVIPVLASQYSERMGIMHDRSQTGATFYIEPNETVELNNRLNQLRQDERVELDRILRALTSEIGIRCDALEENCRLIGILDYIYASAKYAIQVSAEKPVIKAEPAFRLVEARHPLLIRQLGGEKAVVPLSLDIDDSRQGVLITGPNTGGKTIALKTIGLLVLMAQSGLPIPAREASEIGIFRQMHADIGDEQSIELSLSTFSSHIKNIIAATDDISNDTLVLFDEIGAGTDPKEGAALAEAIIQYVLKRGAKLLATTHYSHLKTLALEHPEIENASLEFDRKTLAPTFRLQLGIPGSSYAVEIASRLGMPSEVCEEASTLLGTGERSMAELIASLEEELAKVRDDRAALSDRLSSTRQLEEYYQTKIQELEREIKERKHQALKETEDLLDHTRKETERLVADIRQRQAPKKTVRQLHKKVRESKERVRDVRKGLEPKRQNVDPSVFQAGDTVRIISLNKTGEVEELIGNAKARVRVGNVTTVVELRNLERLGSKENKAARDTKFTPSSDTETSFSPEIHLRGMTVEEAREALDRFLDQAVVSGVTQVYVVHGKGTGKLRRSLSEYLKAHPEVASIRMGDWNEGGAGVTIAKLKT
jgi:DNA mismatch repair protein MutS2